MIRSVATLSPKERERLSGQGYGPTTPEPSDQASATRRQPWWFIMLEVALLVAVPGLGFFGARALLSTTAGTFTAQPLAGEPGWRVLVDPSPVIAITELLDGSVTGITLIAQPGQGSVGGALVMVPGSLQLSDGRSLNELTPADAMTALSAELELGFTETFVVSPTDWLAVLGDSVYSIDNPDPIPAVNGSPGLPVGRVEIDAASAAVFLGVSADRANPLSLLFRRELFWRALLADPPTTSDPVAGLIAQLAGGDDRIDDLPTTIVGGRPIIDAAGAEALIRAVVPLPQGFAPGGRVVIRIVDRTGKNDTRALALMLGSRGFEISEIANAEVFDDGPTQLVVPSLVDIEAMRELAADLGADTVSPDPVGETELSTVVLLVGSDIDLGG